jgi:hypothetical protein
MYSGTGYYVSGSFDFSFSGQSEYVVELFYNNTTASSVTTMSTATGVVAQSSDGYNFLYSTNTLTFGEVFTTTVPTGEELQATIDVYEQGATPPPTDGTINWVESGLPAGTSWSISYHTVLNTASNSTLTSTTTTNSLTMALGNTVYYWVSSAGYSPSPSTGILDLSSASMTVNIIFAGGVSVNSYSVTFIPSPIPSSTTWGVTINGLTQYGSNLNWQSPNIVFSLPAGTYSFSVYSGLDSASPSSGSIAVTGNTVQYISINAPAPPPVQYYAVVFSESGLPSGATWSVTFNGAASSTSSTSLSWSEPNGTYSYSASATGYSASPSSGSITVRGASYSQVISFIPLQQKKYQVTISESGLAVGTQWAASIGSNLSISSSSTISFSEPNGSYVYGITQISGYSVSPSSGSVTVSGAPQSISVTFSSLMRSYGAPSVEISVSQDHLINGTVSGPAGANDSSWSLLSILASSSNYSRFFNLTPLWNQSGDSVFSLQVPYLNTTYALSFRLSGTDAVSAFYNTTAYVKGTTNAPVSYSFSPVPGTVLSGTRTLGIWLRGSQQYVGYVIYSGTTTNGQSIPAVNSSLVPSIQSNGTQHLTFLLNTSTMFSGSYVFAYHVMYASSQVLSVDADYQVSSVMQLSLQYSWSYLKGNNGLYNLTWNVTEVDPSTNEYAAINDLKVYTVDAKTGSNLSIGYFYAKYAKVDGRERAYFNFTVYNLPVGNYTITATAYNTSDSNTMKLFTTTYDYVVPDVAPPSSGGGGQAQPWWYFMTGAGIRDQAQAEIFLGGVGMMALVAVILVAYSARSKRKTRGPKGR